jgi:septal ring factor EnvC (AmiA/AmiB activator)
MYNTENKMSPQRHGEHIGGLLCALCAFSVELCVRIKLHREPQRVGSCGVHCVLRVLNFLKARTEPSEIIYEIKKISDEMKTGSDEIESISDEIKSISDKIEKISEEIGKISDERETISEEIDSPPMRWKWSPMRRNLSRMRFFSSHMRPGAKWMEFSCSAL